MPWEKRISWSVNSSSVSTLIEEFFAVGDTTYNSLYYTAGAFAYMERLDSAVYYYAKAVKMKPKMAVGLYRLGVVETQLGAL